MLGVRNARFNMRATIIRYGDNSEIDESQVDYEWVQDEDSGALVPVPIDHDEVTPGTQGKLAVENFPCMARGIIDGGIRVNGAGEAFAKEYEATHFVKITFPKEVLLTNRDQVTNIRKNNLTSGASRWIEPNGIPTIFDVNGVVPVTDPFGRHVENFAMLQRAEIQEPNA